jgi:hypothetical protein
MLRHLIGPFPLLIPYFQKLPNSSSFQVSPLIVGLDFVLSTGLSTFLVAIIIISQLPNQRFSFIPEFLSY